MNTTKTAQKINFGTVEFSAECDIDADQFSDGVTVDNVASGQGGASGVTVVLRNMRADLTDAGRARIDEIQTVYEALNFLDTLIPAGNRAENAMSRAIARHKTTDEYLRYAD